MSSRAWALFAAVSIIWGVPYLLIKVAIEDGMSPEFLSWVRCAIGAAVLAPFALSAGAMRGLRARWKLIVGFALIQIVLPWPLIAFGEQWISSSLTAILMASMPMMVALFSLRFDPEERPSRVQLTGLVIGMAGVVALVGIDIGGHPQELLGALFVLLAAVGYAAGPVIIKLRLPEAEPLGIATVSLFAAGVMLAPLAATAVPARPPSLDAATAIVALSVGASAIGIVCFVALVREAGPARAMVTSYVNPVVAVALGVLLLDEHLGPGALAGMLLILVGSWIATTGVGAPSVSPADKRARSVA